MEMMACEKYNVKLILKFSLGMQRVKKIVYYAQNTTSG